MEKIHLLNSSTLSLSLCPSQGRKKSRFFMVETWRKIMAGVGIEPLTFRWKTSTLPTIPQGYLDMRCNPLSSISCLAAKQRPGCYPREIAKSVIYGPPAVLMSYYTFCCITLRTSKVNTRVQTTELKQKRRNHQPHSARARRTGSQLFCTPKIAGASSGQLRMTITCAKIWRRWRRIIS